MKIAAVAIGPIQHRRNGKATLAEWHSRRRIIGVLGHYSQDFSQFESDTAPRKNSITVDIGQVYREFELNPQTSALMFSSQRLKPPLEKT